MRPSLRIRTASVAPCEFAIGVHVLAQEGDFSRATGHQVARLLLDPVGWPADLRASRVRHDAERAELVATFLHREKDRR